MAIGMRDVHRQVYFSGYSNNNLMCKHLALSPHNFPFLLFN